MGKKKKAEDIEVKSEVLKPEVKTKEFTLKRDHDGKKAGETIQVGKIGEQFYKSKNII